MGALVGLGVGVGLLLIWSAFALPRTTRPATPTSSRRSGSNPWARRVRAHSAATGPSAVPAERGRMRDTAMFSITDDDWPSVRTAMRARLGR